MSRKKIVDAVDLKIINILKSNANITNKELATLVGLTPGPTLTRVNNLIEKNIIKEFCTKVDNTYLGFTYEAMILVKVSDRNLFKFEQSISESKFVLTVHHISKSKEQFKSTANTFVIKVIAQNENHFIQVTAELYSKFPSEDLSFEILPIAECIKDTFIAPTDPKWL